MAAEPKAQAPITAVKVAVAARQIWPEIDFYVCTADTVLGRGDIVTALLSDRRQVTWFIRPHRQSSVLIEAINILEVDAISLDALNREWNPQRTPTIADAMRLIKDTLAVLSVPTSRR